MAGEDPADRTGTDDTAQQESGPVRDDLVF
jgi:hypothetical protein